MLETYQIAIMIWWDKKSFYETSYFLIDLNNFQMFLSVPDYFRYNKEAERDVKTATNFFISLQTASGNIELVSSLKTVQITS